MSSYPDVDDPVQQEIDESRKLAAKRRADLEAASVGDMAALIRDKAQVIVDARVEVDIIDALGHIEAATRRIRAIL